MADLEAHAEPASTPSAPPSAAGTRWQCWQRHWERFLTLSEAWLTVAFEIEERRTSIRTEVYCGVIHFISCLYVLPVIPNQLSSAGYDTTTSIEVIAVCCAIGCISSSYIANLPLVIAPPASIAIYLTAVLQQNNLSVQHGNTAVILSGIVLMCVGICQPLLVLVSYLIPDCIQASTAVGIGLITALAGAIELDLVVPGKYTIVEMGPITPAIIIATIVAGIIGLATHYRYKGAFLYGLVFGTLTWWASENDWPTALSNVPSFDTIDRLHTDRGVVLLLFNLIFLYILTVNGIARSMSDLAGLTKDGAIPRGNWLFILCGLTTIVSGCLSGPPILISPETAGGVKAGARTGLSTAVCGVLFGLSMFFCPVFSAVPPASTSPLLILVGMTLFMNTDRINWNHSPEAVPAFFVLLLIPFTYSILAGVCFGYVLYIGIGLFSGDLFVRARRIVDQLKEQGLSYRTLLKTFRRAGQQQDGDGQEPAVTADEGKEAAEDGGHTHNPLDPVQILSSVLEEEKASAEGAPRKRRGSIIDMLDMDLDTGIHSMHRSVQS